MKATSNKEANQAKTTVVDLDTVLNHQSQIDIAKQTIQTITSAISSQDKVITKAQARIPQFLDRTSQRENLMAEIALGDVNESELHVLDERIAEDKKTLVESQSEVMPLIEKAQTIRSGLERKLNDARSVLHRLENDSKKIRQLYFIQEAEKTAEEYVANAHAIEKNYLRLRALEILINSQGGKSINGFSINEFYIPAFTLPQFVDLEENNMDVRHGTLCSGRHLHLRNQFVESAKHEKGLFEGLGVDF